MTTCQPWSPSLLVICILNMIDIIMLCLIVVFNVMDHPTCQSEVLIYVTLAWQTIYSLPRFLLECGSTLYVGMPRKQNGRPIHCIV